VRHQETPRSEATCQLTQSTDATKPLHVLPLVNERYGDLSRTMIPLV
jgi:hypothetical protein